MIFCKQCSAYDLFKGKTRKQAYSTETQQKISNLRNYIKSDKNWMSQIEKKAALNKIPVDSMLTIDAIWQVEQEGKK